MSKIEAQTRFVAESRIDALATLGNLSRSFVEMRVDVRSYLLASNDAERAAARIDFDEDEKDVARLLERYADSLVVSNQVAATHSRIELRPIDSVLVKDCE